RRSSPGRALPHAVGKPVEHHGAGPRRGAARRSVPPAERSMSTRDREVVSGRARVDRRTKNLLNRLSAGEVAVIDHEDLDRIAAEGLVEVQPAVIINAARSLSGRYPNVCPLPVAAAGIPLVDDVGHAVMNLVAGGQA